MFRWFSRRRDEKCGGVVTKTTTTTPLKNITGFLIRLQYSYVVQGNKYQFSLENRKFTAKVSVSDNEPYSYETELSDESGIDLTEFIKTCGFNEMNGYSYHVGGLPEDCGTLSFSAYFSSDQTISVHFNGGRSPDNFKDRNNQLIKYFAELSQCPFSDLE